MPNFFCEYCGIYLKHSSPFGRKQHAKGRKHIQNKIEYYKQFLIEFSQQGPSGPAMAGPPGMPPPGMNGGIPGGHPPHPMHHQAPPMGMSGGPPPHFQGK